MLVVNSLHVDSEDLVQCNIHSENEVKRNPDLGIDGSFSFVGTAKVIDIENIAIAWYVNCPNPLVFCVYSSVLVIESS